MNSSVQNENQLFSSILRHFFIPAVLLTGLLVPLMIVMSKGQGGWLHSGLVGIKYWLIVTLGYWLPIGVFFYRWTKGNVTRFLLGYLLSIPLYFLTLYLVYQALGADLSPRNLGFWAIYTGGTLYIYPLIVVLYLLVKNAGKKARLIKTLSATGFILSWIAFFGLLSVTPGYYWPDVTTGRTKIVNARIVFPGEDRILDGYNVHVENGEIIGLIDAEFDQTTFRELDANGGYLIPGLIDVHTHLLVPIRDVTAGLDAKFMIRSFLRDFAPHRQAYLEHGVTTVRDVGDAGTKSFEIRKALQNREILGPRLYATGRLVAHPEGHPVKTIWTSIVTNQAAILADDEDTMIEGLATNFREGPPDAVKIIYGTISRPVERLSQDMLVKAINWSKEKGLISIIHAETAEEVLAATMAGASGIEHVASIEQITPRLRAALIEKKPFITPTFGELVFAINLGNPEKTGEVLQQSYAFMKDLYDVGIPFALGTDAPLMVYGKGLLEEMQHYLQMGLTPAQILTIATENNAAYLGAGNELGIISEGYKADMVLLKENPLQNLQALEEPVWVMLDGQIVVQN